MADKVVKKQLHIVQEPTLFSELSTGQMFSFDKEAESLLVKLSKSKARNLKEMENQLIQSSQMVYRIILSN